ncbi:Uncharacterized protein Fot_51901 [Forsythia ovata]|uniref:Longin domain-containing protein n=1 Tax=Forsythia ovata TaxID=205694 RepID=A0ABD1PWS4_9LAMI
MGQHSLIYSFVARGTVIVAEYTENFTSIAFHCLLKLPATNNKFTYDCDGHTFNYLVVDGFTYCVVDLLPLNLLAGRFLWHFLSELRRILPRNMVGERLLQLLLTA